MSMLFWTATTPFPVCINASKCSDSGRGARTPKVSTKKGRGGTKPLQEYMCVMSSTSHEQYVLVNYRREPDVFYIAHTRNSS